MDVKMVVEEFDQYLAKRALKFEAVIIGGAALNIMGIISRETRDVDCLDPQIPNEIRSAAEQFSNENTKFNLAKKWINNGPDSLKSDLESGWFLRTQIIFNGRAILFRTLSRIDLLKSKLFAYCDRDLDFQDCLKMKPTLEELNECYKWVSERDGNPGWSKNVESHFNNIKKELGYGK
jgi:hypothetical protein